MDSSFGNFSKSTVRFLPLHRKKMGVFLAVVAAIAALLAGMAFVPMDPHDFEAHVEPFYTIIAPYEGVTSRNRRLVDSEIIVQGLDGPEDFAFDALGRMYTALGDGRIVRVDVESGTYEQVAETGGRGLGSIFLFFLFVFIFFLNPTCENIASFRPIKTCMGLNLEFSLSMTR